MAELTYTWRGKELESLWHKASLTALHAIAQRLVELCRVEVSDDYPPASDPWTPPHKRTGIGQRSIVTRIDPTTTSAALVVLSRAKYMLYLELGTHRILPRPWLRPTIIRHHRELELLGHTTFARVMRGGR